MATYNRTADLTCEAHELGAASPPTWYTTAVADQAIKLLSDGAYIVCERTGWSKGVVGDFVVYTAAADPLPKFYTLVSKADFDATYELDVEE